MEIDDRNTDGQALFRAAAELPAGSIAVEGIAAAGQPRPEQIKALADAGFKSIIDLRAPSEPRGFDEKAEAGKAGLTYENIPVTPATLDDSDFDRLRELLNDKANKPAVVHCASANRVGALLIPYLILDEKKSREEALEIARGAGLRSQELARVALEYAQKNSARNQQ
jgi:protein tyrosine phosphatase (PTP) superfamily phosphohydrolase (DUF442 family)